MMKPCDLLAREHGLIGKVIGMIEDEITCIRQTECLDVGFIETAAAFIENYVGQIHHVKEDMLFQSLSRKRISDDDFKLLNGLVEEHQQAKKIMDELLKAKDNYTQGDNGSLPAVIDRMNALVAFYPRHMNKEEAIFFPRAEGYFSQNELQAMLREFQDLNAAIVRYNTYQLAQKNKTFKDENAIRNVSGMKGENSC